jgi:hypothetical protein
MHRKWKVLHLLRVELSSYPTIADTVVTLTYTAGGCVDLFIVPQSARRSPTMTRFLLSLSAALVWSAMFTTVINAQQPSGAPGYVIFWPCYIQLICVRNPDLSPRARRCSSEISCPPIPGKDIRDQIGPSILRPYLICIYSEGPYDTICQYTGVRNPPSPQSCSVNISPHSCSVKATFTWAMILPAP